MRTRGNNRRNYYYSRQTVAAVVAAVAWLTVAVEATVVADAHSVVKTTFVLTVTHCTAKLKKVMVKRYE